jgi:hypothetical protein
MRTHAQMVWHRIKEEVQRHPPKTFLRFRKRDLPHPKEAGAKVSLGIPRGQITDYRFPPGHDCRGVHVQEFDGYWEAHIDEVHPACDLVEHLRVDAPGGWVAVGALVGGLVGLAIGRSKGAFAAGACLGLLLSGATTDSVLRGEQRRERPA